MLNTIGKILKAGVVAVCLGIIFLVGLIFVVLLKLPKHDPGKTEEEVRAQFAKDVEEAYGLRQEDYTIVEVDRSRTFGKTVVVFRSGDKDHYAVIDNHNSEFFSDYCTEQIRAALAERIDSVLAGSKMLQEVRYEVSEITFGIGFDHITPEGTIVLPKRVTSETIALFKQGRENREEWGRGANVRFSVKILPYGEGEFTKEQFSAMNDALYFVTGMTVYGRYQYNYDPVNDRLMTFE